MKYKVRDLYAAFIALAEWEASTKPQAERQGDQIVRRSPLVSPLPSQFGFRLALNRNALRSVAETFEAKLQEIDEEYTTQVSEAASAQRLQELRREREVKIRALQEQEVEWSSPARIDVRQLGDRQIPEGWLAALAMVGIIVEEPSGDGKPSQ